MTAQFRIGIGADFLNGSGECAWGDIGLAKLSADPAVSWGYLPIHEPVLTAETAAGHDGILLNGGAVTAASFGPEPPLVIARFGVGFDSIDLGTCNQNGVLVTNTPLGVRRPMALATLTMLLAAAHQLIAKDDIVRNGGWEERLAYRGRRLTGATLGVIGLGGIAREFLTLAAPLGLEVIAHDPYLTDVSDTAVRLAPLDEVMASDYVIVLAPLTPETRHLIGARELALMKPGAWLLNLARGPIVDQQALERALQAGAIGGAALDVFEVEPLPADSVLRTLPNAILTPHAIGWTDELAAGNGAQAIENLLAVAHGRIPPNVVNPEALAHPRLQHLTQPGSGHA